MNVLLGVMKIKVDTKKAKLGFYLNMFITELQ